MSWCSDVPEDQVICLFAGLFTNPDMTRRPEFNNVDLSCWMDFRSWPPFLSPPSSICYVSKVRFLQLLFLSSVTIIVWWGEIQKDHHKVFFGKGKKERTEVTSKLWGTEKPFKNSGNTKADTKHVRLSQNEEGKVKRYEEKDKKRCGVERTDGSVMKKKMLFIINR
jgi:hypothetical protein